MNKIIAITIGDIKGIGIELILSLWIKNIKRKFVIFSDKKVIKAYLKKNKHDIDINIVNKNNKIIFKNNKLNVYHFYSKNDVENTYKSLIFAHEECFNQKFSGLITLPLRKDLIIKYIDSKFEGQTELFQKLEKKESVNMIFTYKNIIISTLTTHIPLNKIINRIKNKKYISNRIKSLNNSLKEDFAIKKPKILISGINPHSGENGKIGNEEIKFIIPEINKAKKLKINIDGPISGDAMLNALNMKKYNCFLFIFHDQALIPFKLISRYSGVNYTSNLKIIRTSPDHGTAYNLVGKNKASHKSLLNCFNVINKIIKNRKID